MALMSYVLNGLALAILLGLWYKLGLRWYMMVLLLAEPVNGVGLHQKFCTQGEEGCGFGF